MCCTEMYMITFNLLLCLFVELWWISPREGSIAGGTTVTVRGADFATDQFTGQNLVFLDDVPCIVEGYVTILMINRNCKQY